MLSCRVVRTIVSLAVGRIKSYSDAQGVYLNGASVRYRKAEPTAVAEMQRRLTKGSSLSNNWRLLR